jgi:hypothetical protein
MTEAEMIPVLERVIESAEAMRGVVRNEADAQAENYIEGAREYLEVGEWLLSYEEVKLLEAGSASFRQENGDDLRALAEYFAEALSDVP